MGMCTGIKFNNYLETFGIATHESVFHCAIGTEEEVFLGKVFCDVEPVDESLAFFLIGYGECNHVGFLTIVED